jgi:hypothetical protein
VWPHPSKDDLKVGHTNECAQHLDGMISRETASSGEMLDNSGRKQQTRAPPQTARVGEWIIDALKDGRAVGTHPAGAGSVSKLRPNRALVCGL